MGPIRMRRLRVVLLTLFFPVSAFASETYELKLVYIFESPRVDFIFVVGNSGFRTVTALQNFVASLPEGTTLRWSPGCERFGGEPLLSSDHDMDEFKAFCRQHHVNFVLVPSG